MKETKRANAMQTHTTNSLAEAIRSKGCALTVNEVSSLLSIPIKSIYRLAKADRIPSFKLGGSIRFDPIILADWYESKAVV